MKQYFLLISIVFCVDSLFGQDITSIISKTENKYANIETYFDSGKVVSSFYNLPHPFSNAKLFKTSYSNTGLFNFEYYELGKSNSLFVINRSLNNKVQSWWGITDKLKTDASLSIPLNSARGVSSLTSTLIPELLFPNNKISGKNIFKSIADTKLASIEEINGNSCYKIVGQGKLGETIEIWISKKDFLILKIEIDKKVKDFNVKSSYQFFPYNLKGANAELFKFKPNRQIIL